MFLLILLIGINLKMSGWFWALYGIVLCWKFLNWCEKCRKERDKQHVNKDNHRTDA